MVSPDLTRRTSIGAALGLFATTRQAAAKDLTLLSHDGLTVTTAGQFLPIHRRIRVSGA